MTSIEEGGIIFQVPNKGIVEVTNKYEDSMKLGDLPQDITDGIGNDLKDSMSKALDSIEDELVHALASANRLCLPAAGTFFMKDPIFNQKGDLLVGLAYDGYLPYFTWLSSTICQFLTLKTGLIHHRCHERANTDWEGIKHVLRNDMFSLIFE